MQDCKIEFLNFLVVTDSTLIEDTFMLKHVGLSRLTLAKAIEYGFGNGVRTIADRIEAAVPFANDFVVIGTVAKTQSRMGL